MSTLQKILATIVVLGAVTSVIGATTFATFSAQTTNPGNTFKAGTVAMTNVAGSVVSGTNCSTETINGVCATLFTLAGLVPGAAASSNTATITYTGTLTTSDFRLFATSYSTKTGASAAVCTATDPATKVDLQVKIGTTIIYPTSGSGFGTLAGFAAAYTTSANGLQLNGGTNGSGSAGIWATNDASTYTINVALNSTVDNTYQGCQSSATLNWYAAQ